MTKITLPGSIPGLLRQGSPVILEDIDCIVLEAIGREGVIVAERRGTFSTSAHMICVNLENPTGRAHAIWWLAGKTKIKFTSFNQISFCVTLPTTSRWGLRVDDSREDDEDDLVVWSAENSRDYYHTKIDALTGLNCNDEALLADGSRWVDAEALRRICLHVAGLSQSK